MKVFVMAAGKSDDPVKTQLNVPPLIIPLFILSPYEIEFSLSNDVPSLTIYRSIVIVLGPV